MSNIYDRLDEAGHDLTHVDGPSVGRSSYYCEKCGSILILAGDTMKLFHAPAGSRSEPFWCRLPATYAAPVHTLKSKLAALDHDDHERLKAI
jgi:hypothetical protein